MRRVSMTTGALLGALTTLPLMALFYLGDAFAGLPFVPFVFFDWLARVLPGDVITLGIDGIVRTINTLNLGDTSGAAKQLEQLMAIAIVLVAGTLVGAGLAWALSRFKRPATQLGAVVGVLLFFISWAAIDRIGFNGDPSLSLLWVALLWVGWGALLARWIASDSLSATDTVGYTAGRRAALLKIAGGSVGVALAAWGMGRVLGGQASTTGASKPLAGVPEPGSLPTPLPDTAGTPPRPLPEATAVAETGDRLLPAPGTRPELTPNEDFYRIDINTRPPVLQQETWQLEVSGLFDNPQTLSLDELMAYPTVTQTITIGCISNRVAGDLIGTSNWTGVRLRDLVEQWGIKPSAQALYVEAADGFYETVVKEDFMDPRTLLVYGMNGETLPVEHGFPLRIYIPNRYGMKQPKWITRIEAVDEWEAGYWVTRGWSREARPRIVSVIDAVATEQTENGTVPVGGIAWAGDRGIARVEVQVDEGEWQEAELRVPPLSPLTWVLWRYNWPASDGEHTLRVRATDGTGELQIAKQNGVRPDGATGYHTRTVTI